MQTLDDSPGLCSGVDVSKFKSRLDVIRPVLNKITRFRHQRAAHREYRTSPPPLTFAEVKPAYDELVSIFKGACEFPNSVTYSFLMPGMVAVDRMFERLNPD